ncbi:O-methyltransferase family protein [Phlyctema vagabunda]|uniref:O-methyltransferase family protein n=1 Tax=Phlyctema vagabunda TaxID=108571 RepID=A0ABR4PUH8_9HELO
MSTTTTTTTTIQRPLESVDDLEALSIQLQRAVTSYTKSLTAEHLPQPSLSPSSHDAALRSEKGTAARAEIVRLSQTITAMVMEPDVNLLITSLQFHTCTCLKVAVDLRIHEHIPKDGIISAKALAEAVKADEELLVRIMRVLTAKFIFAEPKPGHYSHTGMSWVLSKTNMVDLVSHRLDDVYRSASREAEALALINYREPSAGDVLGFNLAFSTKSNFWTFNEVDDPERGQRFGRAMKAVSINALRAIPETFQFQSLVADGGLVVDVGGGLGQVSQTIADFNRGIGLKFIVQDATTNLNNCNDQANIQYQIHDFFKEQPVKGASAYFFRHIFHDWPDSACAKLLKHTVDAMDDSRSRILICDQILQDINPSVPSMLYDIDMMSLYGGKERTMSQWQNLLRGVDQRLIIAKVWKHPAGSVTILEAKLSL